MTDPRTIVILFGAFICMLWGVREYSQSRRANLYRKLRLRGLSAHNARPQLVDIAWKAGQDPLPFNWWKKIDPCDLAEEEIVVDEAYGRANNVLIELLGAVELALGSFPPKAIRLHPSFPIELLDGFDWKSALESYVCFRHPTSITQVTYRHAMDIFNWDTLSPPALPPDFRARVLAEILLRPKSAVIEKVEQFERQNNLSHGYNAIALRHFETTFETRIWFLKWSGLVGFYPNVTLVRKDAAPLNISSEYIASYSRDGYILPVIRDAGTEHLPCVILHDGQDPEEAKKLIAELGCLTSPHLESPHHSLGVDMSLMLRSTVLIGNPYSTVNMNVMCARSSLLGLKKQRYFDYSRSKSPFNHMGCSFY